MTTSVSSSSLNIPYLPILFIMLIHFYAFFSSIFLSNWLRSSLRSYKVYIDKALIYIILTITNKRIHNVTFILFCFIIRVMRLRKVINIEFERHEMFKNLQTYSKLYYWKKCFCNENVIILFRRKKNVMNSGEITYIHIKTRLVSINTSFLTNVYSSI